MLYVDHLRIPFGQMLMSHLVADTQEELRDAAKKIGSPGIHPIPRRPEGNTWTSRNPSG